MGYLILAGWMILLAMIIMFNYGAHRREKSCIEDSELKSVNVSEEDETVIF